MLRSVNQKKDFFKYSQRNEFGKMEKKKRKTIALVFFFFF